MTSDAQPVNAYRRFVQAQLDARGWSQAELARASGISPAVISRILKDDQTRLRKLPADTTIAGLAQAFGGGRMQARLWLSVAQAMGIPVTTETLVADPALLTDDELAREVGMRLAAAPAANLRGALSSVRSELVNLQHELNTAIARGATASEVEVVKAVVNAHLRTLDRAVGAAGREHARQLQSQIQELFSLAIEIHSDAQAALSQSDVTLAARNTSEPKGTPEARGMNEVGEESQDPGGDD